MRITDLKPELIWHYFDEITKVPRPSKKEEKIRSYLLMFAQEQGLAVKQDKIGNILMSKPASAGCENAPVVTLQSHMDMVCEKNSNTVHNFETDPIETIIDGDWVRANGTTLGADNGIGMAAQLAVLADKNLKHGPVNALFTVDEETGLTGAFNMDDGMIEGKYLLNLDSEDEGQLFIGCAGGIDTTSEFTYSPSMTPDNYLYFKISVKNLLGGHSGGDIHRGRGNANRILARFLWQTSQKYDMVMSSIDGGNLRNAIPREASAVIGIHKNDKEKVRVDLNLYISVIEDELKGIEPNFTMVMEHETEPERCIDRRTTIALINALYACPHGVVSMSRDMEGLVQTSTNLASVKMSGENKIVVATSQRSSVESEKYDIAHRVECVFALAGATVVHGEGYPGWKPNMESSLLSTAVAAYEDLFGVKPLITAIHAGLECGLFLKKHPQLDMISFGPTLSGVHSPDEKMNIPSVEKFWKHLTAVLEKIAESNA
ncbi:MAG: aminoacyl-histidine dipeptidase [Bacteroidaceae bacterium]|nr:aminoacyl-histidine dipeptidase [Bacteroidaceae bacterium]